MHTDADQGDTNSLYPTPFDIERLKSMDVGDKVSSENGNWDCLRYRGSYSLILHNSLFKESFQEFKTLKELVNFLQSH